MISPRGTWHCSVGTPQYVVTTSNSAKRGVGFVNPTLQVRKLELRKVKKFVHGYMAGKRSEEIQTPEASYRKVTASGAV